MHLRRPVIGDSEDGQELQHIDVCIGRGNEYQKPTMVRRSIATAGDVTNVEYESRPSKIWQEEHEDAIQQGVN